MKRVLLVALVFSSCSAEPAPKKPDPLKLATFEDMDPDPRIVEINLEARETDKSYGEGTPTRVWSYNGTVPGPLVDANVGDRLIVHFKNSLPEPTTIHWHGIRLPATMDGSLAMQNPIQPGSRFEYSFTLKDAGLFWFHPHIRSDIQVQKGLYGAIRVRGPEEPGSDVEQVLVLDDIRLGRDGTIDEYLDDNAKMLGREGQTILVNGQPNQRLSVQPGALVRLRLVNVANARFFNLRLAGVLWRVIGSDGGLLPKPYDADTLLMSPGERYDVMFVAPSTPRELTMTTEPYNRGHESGGGSSLHVLTISVEGQAIVGKRELPTAFSAVERLTPSSNDIPIALDEAIRGEDVVFLINGKAYPDVPAIKISPGEVRSLDVSNKSEMDHPFHLHGFFFQVLAQNGVPTANDRVYNKDTIIVPAKTDLRLVSRFDEPGKWMYHCHILEHAEHGMMGEIHVE